MLEAFMHDYGTFLNLIITFLTLVVLIVYTYYTRRQTKELIHQRRLSVMPSIFTQVISENNIRKLRLTNIGNGIALNVTIDDIDKYDSHEKGYFSFLSIPKIKAGESEIVIYSEKDLGRDIESKDSCIFLLEDHGLSKWMHEKYQKQRFYVQIHFQDIEGTKYSQINIMGNEGYQQGFVRVDKTTL